MENANRLESYLTLLEVKKKTYHRNAFIAGGVLLIAILNTSGILLLTDWNERSIWLMGVLDVLITISFLMAWVRFEIAKENMNLVKNLQV